METLIFLRTHVFYSRSILSTLNKNIFPQAPNNFRECVYSVYETTKKYYHFSVSSSTRIAD